MEIYSFLTDGVVKNIQRLPWNLAGSDEFFNKGHLHVLTGNTWISSSFSISSSCQRFYEEVLSAIVGMASNHIKLWMWITRTSRVLFQFQACESL
jgi:hypothetical protein